MTKKDSFITYILSLISLRQKRMVKKILRRPINLRVISRDSNWVNDESLKFEVYLQRKTDRTISSNMESEKELPLITLVKDYHIERQSRGKQYVFEEMLVILDPYGCAPLCALAIFYTKTKSSVRFTVKGAQPRDDVGGITESTQYHRVPIFGLYPGKTNEVCMELLDENENEIASRKIKIKTDKLPSSLKKAIKVEKFAVDSAFNLTFILGGISILPCAYDSAGVIRYYLSEKPKGYGLLPLYSQGRFLFCERNILSPNYANPHAAQIYDMDLFGRFHKTYMSEIGIHHDACEMSPGGNFLSLSSSLCGHTEDMIVEIDRNTGKVVKKLDMREVLGDSYRDLIDWAHVNAVSYDEKNNTVLLSLRNVHSGIRVNWETKELLWVLADPRFWEDTPIKDKVLQPVGIVDWHYQAHAIYELPEDLDHNPDTKHIIVFDNHWNKRRNVSHFDNDPDSYVCIYTINEKLKTVSMEHRYKCPKSKIRSNALLAFDQRRVFAMEGFLEPKIEEKLGMIYEYDYDTEEVLNAYSIKPGFFRAIEFFPDYDALAKPMKKDKNYVVGDLTDPICVDTIPIVSQDQLEENISFVIREDIVYIKAQDHALQEVYFVGSNIVYKKDYKKTEQSLEVFENITYFVAISISNFELGEYKIYLNYKGIIYDSKKKINLERRKKGKE